MIARFLKNAMRRLNSLTLMSSEDKTLATMAKERRNRPKLLANEDKEFDDLLKTAEEARRKEHKNKAALRGYQRE
jgi:hypothetical protein